MNTLATDNIAGVTVTINGTPYTYEAHSLDKVAEILGSSQAVLTDGSRIEGITINYFTA
jgi:hypothetical protein